MAPLRRRRRRVPLPPERDGGATELFAPTRVACGRQPFRHLRGAPRQVRARLARSYGAGPGDAAASVNYCFVSTPSTRFISTQAPAALPAAPVARERRVAHSLPRRQVPRRLPHGRGTRVRGQELSTSRGDQGQGTLERHDDGRADRADGDARRRGGEMGPAAGRLLPRPLPGGDSVPTGTC